MKFTNLGFRPARWLRAAAMIAVLGAASVGTAQELAGLNVGEKGPAFELQNQAGNPVKLDELLQKGPVALVFFRSADW